MFILTDLVLKVVTVAIKIIIITLKQLNIKFHLLRPFYKYKYTRTCLRGCRGIPQRGTLQSLRHSSHSYFDVPKQVAMQNSCVFYVLRRYFVGKTFFMTYFHCLKGSQNLNDKLKHKPMYVFMNMLLDRRAITRVTRLRLPRRLS